MNAPRVTVLIPAFNAAPTLARALDSVLAQTERSLEVIVLDDGSTDGTAAVADEHAARDQRLRVVRLPRNGGKSTALNEGLTIARGTWIAILDADDRWAESRLEVLLAEAELRGASLVADELWLVDGANQTATRRRLGPRSRPLALADLAPDRLARRFDFALLKPLVRRDFTRSHDLRYRPPATTGEDFFFLFDFFAAGGEAWLHAAPLYFYTLPVSPSTGHWTTGGLGAWRYDYRGIAALVRAELQRTPRGPLSRVLEARLRHYELFEAFQRAARAFQVEGRPLAALALLARSPPAAIYAATRVVSRALTRRRDPRPGPGRR